MPNPITIGIGRLVQAAAGLRGGGSALPGLVVEKLEPNFARDIFESLPCGVVLVSGTNGKTTTVKIVTELLTAAGLRVFTNNTGSNFMRGVISSLLRKVSLRGKLHADIAVLELDEAHAVNFVASIKPRYALLLNVMRDQLDRFGEIDYTAQLLKTVATHTTGLVVLNREDSRLSAISLSEDLVAEVRWFGLTSDLKREFPDDDSLNTDDLINPANVIHKNKDLQISEDILRQEESRAVRSDDMARPLNLESSQGMPATNNTVILSGVNGSHTSFVIDGKEYRTELSLKGMHNAFNAAAAIALVHAIVPVWPVTELMDALSAVRSAFGRGETVTVKGQPLELVLVKNPGGFRMALKSFDATSSATMISINDEFGDGRDVSWLYDVDFQSLKGTGVAMTSGTRAFDMALRLAYDEVPVAEAEPDLSKALNMFLSQHQDTPKRIYCSYTTMLSLRKLLSVKTEVERIR